MIDPVPLYSDAIPLAFFVWGPALVMLLFWLAGFWASRPGRAALARERLERLQRRRCRQAVFAPMARRAGASIATASCRPTSPSPSSTAIVGALTDLRAGRRAASRSGSPRSAAAAGCSAAVCDVAENLAVARLLDRYPQLERRRRRLRLAGSRRSSSCCSAWVRSAPSRPPISPGKPLAAEASLWRRGRAAGPYAARQTRICRRALPCA